MDITFNNFKCILYSFGEAIARKKDAIFALFEGIFSRRYQQTAPLLNDKEIDLDEPAVAPKAQAVFFEHLLPQHQLLIQLQKKYEKALAHENAGWIETPLDLDLLGFLGCDTEKFLDHSVINKLMTNFLLDLSNEELKKMDDFSSEQFEEFIMSKTLDFRFKTANISIRDRVYINQVSAILDDLKTTIKQEMKELKNRLPVLTNLSPELWKEFVKSHIYQNLHAFLIGHKQLLADRKALVDVKEKHKKGIKNWVQKTLFAFYQKHQNDNKFREIIWLNYYREKITIPFNQGQGLEKLGINSNGVCYALAKRQAMNAYRYPDLPLKDREMDVVKPSDVSEQAAYENIFSSGWFEDAMRILSTIFEFNYHGNELTFSTFNFPWSEFPKNKIITALQIMEGNFDIGTFGWESHAMFLRLDPKTQNYYFFEPNYGPLAFTTKAEAIECCLEACRLLHPKTALFIHKINPPPPASNLRLPLCRYGSCSSPL